MEVLTTKQKLGVYTTMLSMASVDLSYCTRNDMCLTGLCTIAKTALEKMFELAKEDLKIVTAYNHDLDRASHNRNYSYFELSGLCAFAKDILIKLEYAPKSMPFCCIQNYLPELLEYKPANADLYWWPVAPMNGKNTRRIEILEEIIANLKNK